MGQKFAALNADRFVVGFYDHEVHGDSIPAGSVAIDDEHHTALLDGQSAGKRMKLCDKGLPLLVDHAPPTDAELAAMLRTQRKAALDATDWLVARHQDETISGDTPSLTVKQCKALIDYRKKLRALPDSKGFPHIGLPVAPDFIGVK
jgi:Phage tail assembly chaperone protein